MDYGKEFKKYATKHLGLNSLYVDKYADLTAEAAGVFNLTPNIIEERQMNAVAMDIFSRLMMDRIIFLGVPI
jgi:ATP-dependent Clp protease protease subunit